MIERMNQLGAARKPFLFVIDFEMRKPIILPLDDIDPREVRFDIRGVRNCPPAIAHSAPADIIKHPVPYPRYLAAFNRVVECQRAGDSYLCNLTFPTRIETNLSLEDIFHRAVAPYRLMLRGMCTVFSPEPFVRVRGGVISSYPMKGTTRADVPGAEAKLLADEKEFAEHLTIVDLIRNDLGIVARNVRVERFRYVEKVSTARGDLLQTSSEITARLPEDWRERIGEIVAALLPAGSVTGAPKKRTVEIIREAEGAERGWYTGIFGVFDGNDLDSAVMIRFIERTESGLFYRSGGGITVYSDPESEYQELIDKVYVPAG
ncbi:MAG TPA: aminodeoxychorismate synthase component I [Spirochaetota bacterium]|nr:aminodeoxychorismate synthase component I [Spirochaetota bacterium]